MHKRLATLSLILGITLVNQASIAQTTSTLPLNIVKDNAVLTNSNSLGLDEQLWGQLGNSGDRQALLSAIDQSLRYLQTPSAVAAYRRYPVPGMTLWRVRRSLVRFRELLGSAKSPAELQAAVKREFTLYQSVGNDKKGTVLFTGYYQPVYQASRTPTAEYRYPVYRLPGDFSRWSKPHPTRVELEGEDALQASRGRLRGLEIAWMRDRMEPYLIQIQGSAQLKLTDGNTISVGYAGATDYPYSSLGRELIKDGKLPSEGLSLPKIVQYFQDKPQELNEYISRNKRFVFFREGKNLPATGSIGVPVTADRSIATDKSLMPPGALALIQTQFPYPSSTGKMEQRLVSRYVLDQDTGSAIKGAGRVDYYMGVGDVAGDRAGVTNSTGQLYYLLLKK